MTDVPIPETRVDADRAGARADADRAGARGDADRAQARVRRRRRQARVLRLVGVLFVAAAVGIGAYVWWMLWGTGFATRRAQAELRPGIERIVGTRDPRSAPSAPRTVSVPGKAVMILKIPKIDVDYVVVEGTGIEALKKGPGHYTGTAYPWQDHGRVAIAGHRTTYGAPFWALDRLRQGDEVVLATEYGIYDYEVSRTAILSPADVSVLDPTRRPSLVLTTCNPRFSAAQRLVVFANRADT